MEKRNERNYSIMFLRTVILLLKLIYSGNSVRLYFLGSKITADGDCSHEINRHLLLGRKVMTNLNSIFKSREITLPTNVCLVKAIFFFQWSIIDVKVGLGRKLSTKELMLLNCGVREDS